MPVTLTSAFPSLSSSSNSPERCESPERFESPEPSDWIIQQQHSAPQRPAAYLFALLESPP